MLEDIEVLIPHNRSAVETSAGKETGFESTVFRPLETKPPFQHVPSSHGGLDAVHNTKVLAGIYRTGPFQLQCEYYNQGHLDKVDQLDDRKIKIHSKKVSCES